MASESSKKKTQDWYNKLVGAPQQEEYKPNATIEAMKRRAAAKDAQRQRSAALSDYKIERKGNSLAYTNKLTQQERRLNKVAGKDSAGVRKMIDQGWDPKRTAQMIVSGQTGEDSDLQYYMEQLERLKQQEQEQEYLKRGTPTISDAEGIGERGALRSVSTYEDGTIAPNMGGYRNYQGMAGGGVSAEDIQKQRELKRDAAWYGQKIAQLDREAKNAQFDEPRVQDELLQGEDPFATIRTAANDAAYEAEMRANKGYSEIPEGLAEQYEQMQEGQKANSQTLADLQERMEAGRKAYATDPANFRELTQAEADYQAWMYKYMLENAQTTQEVDAILDSIASQRVIAEKRQDWDAVERYEGLQEMANQAQETAWMAQKGEEYRRIRETEAYQAYEASEAPEYDTGSVAGVIGSALQAAPDEGKALTGEDRKMYLYLLNSPEYGRKAAEEYRKYYNQTSGSNAAWLEAAENARVNAAGILGVEDGPIKGILNGIGNVGASISSVAANMMAGIGAIDIAAQNAKKWITGDKAPIDYNTIWQLPGQYTQQTRENTAAELNALGTIDIPLLGETGLGQIYQIGMSIADSLAARAVTGGTDASTWILGGSAATAGMQDAKERGADDVTALILGGLNGAFEAVFEKVSLDNLIKMNDAGTIKAALGNIAKQMGIEASEEMFTTIANTIADELVMADKSEMAETAKALMEHGYTKAEAEAEAKRQWLQNFLWDGIGGAISGGFMAGGQQAAQSIQTGVENRKTGGKIISEKNAEALWSIAKGMNEGSEARAAAEKIGEAGKASASQVGEVYRKTISELGEKYSGALKTSVARDAANRLTELGETQNARAVADAIVKLYGGEALTRAERRTVAESLYGIQVTREMLGMEEGRGEAWANRSYAGNLQQTEKTMGSVRQLTKGREKGEAAAKASTAAARAETAAQKMRYAEETEKSDGLTAIGDVRGKITDIDENGNITITAEDGKEATAKLADAEYPSREAAILAAGAQEFGTDGAAIYGLWQQSQQAGAYLDAAERAYQAGQSGRTKYDGGVLSPAQSKAIYDMGRARDAERTGAIKARLQNAPRGTGRLNIDRIREKVHRGGKEGLTARQRTDLQAIALLAKSLKGVDFVIYESETDANGRYVVTGEVAKELGLTSGASAPNGAFDRQGRIWLDINGGKLQSTDELQTSMLRTAGHELTHYIRAFGDQQLWNQLKEFVTVHMEEMGEGLTFDEMVDRNRDAGMEYDDAVEETVANACEMMIRDSQIVNMLAEEKPGLFKNIKAWVDRWTRKIREAFTGIQARSEEARAMEAWAQELQKIWDEALKSAVTSRQTAQKNSVEEMPLDTEKATETEEEILPSTKPLSARDDAEMDSKEAKPFMLQHPEMQMWMVSAAAQLDEELGDAQPAEKFFLSDGSGVTGQKRIASQPIAELLDGYGFTYERIGKTLETILSMDEAAIMRQHKSVKIVENVLDEMLEHGYQSTRHGWVEPDPDYIRDKAAAQGMAKFKEASNEKDRLEKRNSRPEVKFNRREELANELEKKKQIDRRQKIETSMQFRRWFGDSKVVNPDGTPKIMYHGTPYGGFTVFKNWQYFTENREYADKYQNPSASSIRGRYDAATQPMTYDVYLKVLKPFDTRIPKVRKIWQNEFYGAYSSTPLSEKGLPDWTDGIDLVEFIEENELDYDAIILDEGATGGYGDDVISRGISVVVRSSEQVKSATDNMGTFDPENRDIRYSQRRAGELSDREILANAFEGMARNETELDYIRRYRKNIDELNRMQGELDEIQSRMRERMYAKGPRGAEYKAEMEKDRNRAAILGEQIDRMDKKLLNFEAAKPLKDVVARQRAKDRKQIKAEYNKKLEQYRADRDEARKKAGLRYTIRRGVRSLDTALRKSVDAKHVPDELRTPVARICQMFLNQGAFAQKDIAEIAAAYAAMAEGKASSDSHAADLYDPDIEDRLMELEKRLGEYTLADMPTRDLQDVQDIIDHFQHLIEDNNTIFIEGRKANLEQTAKKVEEEMIAAGLRKNNALNNSALWRMMREGMMRPEDFFDHIGGTLGELGKAVLSGETDFGINAQKARDFFEATQKKHGYAKWEKQKDATRELLIVNQITGETDSVKLTIGQALSIYALNKREKTNTAQQGSHIQTGGIQLKVQTDKQGKILKYTQEAGKSIALTEEAIRDIEGWLTNEQKAYADEMVGYLSSDMAELGNEVSKRLHGYSKFTEEYYFPYAVSGDFNRTKLGSDAQVSMLKNFGFTKRLTFMAKKPLAVDDFTAVCAAHVNQMLTYHAFAEAQDAFMRVYDYAISDTSAVKSRVRAAYGQAAETYIRQFMHDLYGGAGKDPSRGILDQWTGLFKAGAVAMNLSVAIQQPSAIARAFAEINPKYFLGSAVEKGGWEQLKKYAGTAVIKDMGRYDTGMGRTVAEWIAGGAAQQTALQKAGRAISDVGGWAPGKMDQITWMRIWNAVKRETAAKTGLTGEALLQEAGKRFDQVTRRTQVYDSVLAKSQMMRSQDAGVKAATSFMAEPTVTYNMLMNAVMNRKKNPKGTMGKVIGAVAVASVFNVLLKSIVAALRDRDEDKSYVEKYLSGVVSGIVGSREVFYLDNVLSPATMLPLVKDVISIFQGYDVTMPWMSVATEAYKAYAMLGSDKKTPYQKIQAVAGAIGNMCGVPIKNVWRDLESVILTFTQTKPLKETSAEGMKYAMLTGLGYDDSDAANVQRMLAAYAKGDKEAMEKARERLEKAGLTDKEIKSKAKSRIREMYLGGIGSTMAAKMLAKFCDMDANDAYFQMEAWDFNEQKDEGSEETYSRFMDIYAAVDKGGSLQTAEKELLSRGYSQDEIDSKVKEYIGKQYREGEYTAAAAKGKLEKYCGMDAEVIYWQMDKWDYMKKNGSTEGYSKYDALYAAVDKGASLESAAQEFLDRGDSWTDIDSAVKEYIRDQYVEGEISFDAAADKLVQYYGSGDNGFDDNALYLWKKQADYRKETGESASSAYCYMYDYISEGNDKLLIAEINDLVAHGKKKSNMATSIVNRYESEYRNLKRSGKAAEAENLKKRVLQVCGYLGYNKSNAVAKWDED